MLGLFDVMSRLSQQHLVWRWLQQFQVDSFRLVGSIVDAVPYVVLYPRASIDYKLCNFLHIYQNDTTYNLAVHMTFPHGTTLVPSQRGHSDAMEVEKT
jgi:hypothetical protein